MHHAAAAVPCWTACGLCAARAYLYTGMQPSQLPDTLPAWLPACAAWTAAATS